MKVLLVGNPNAGKSTLFNALARGHAKVGNWHGVTVGALEKETTLGGRRVTLVDLPGIYTAEGMSMEEKGARSYLAAHPTAPVLFVCECGAVERCLPLFFALAKGRRAALVLTKAKRFYARGGKLDLRLLEKRLGAPVFVAEGLRRGALLAQAARVLSAPVVSPRYVALDGVFSPARTGLSRADALLTNAWFAFPIFLLLLAAAFYLTFAPHCLGDWMKSGIEAFFSEFLVSRAQTIPSPVVRSLLTDGLLPSLGGVLSFLPQIALLMFFLICMEESGFLSRLACLTDGAFAAVGLNGRAVFSLVMGFGCTAAAILTTRGLENKPLQRRVIAILSYISCGAKMPVYLTVASAFFPHPFAAVVALYAAGVLFAFAAALLLRRLIPGEEEFVLELAHPQRPRLRPVLRSLLFSAKQFIIKVATVVTAFLIALWFFLSFNFTLHYVGADSGESMLALACRAFSFLFYPMGVTQWQVALAALSGIVAKESVAGTLALFYGEQLSAAFTPASAVAFLIFILTCSPCVSAVAAAAREVGARRALGMAAAQTGIAFLLSYLVYGLLCAGALAASLLALALPVLLFCLRKRDHEKICRSKKSKSERVHRRDIRARLVCPRAPAARAGRPRQRRAHGKKRHARRGRRSRLLYDPARGSGALLRHRLSG